MPLIFFSCNKEAPFQSEQNGNSPEYILKGAGASGSLTDRPIRPRFTSWTVGQLFVKDMDETQYFQDYRLDFREDHMIEAVNMKDFSVKLGNWYMKGNRYLSIYFQPDGFENGETFYHLNGVWEVVKFSNYYFYLEINGPDVYKKLRLDRYP